MRKFTIPIALSMTIILSVLFYSMITQQLSLIQLSNQLFIVGLPFLVIGGFLWVFSSGFFDHFQRSIFLARTRNRKKKPDFQPLSTVSKQSINIWFIIAGILIGTSILLVLIDILI